ncbi:prolipoprotein diacylglyceryl transferase [Patescibacteria group bacterium]|nr:prolipoprotein diacylglyceryl transferase [Patescibacteria group bacterium]
MSLYGLIIGICLALTSRFFSKNNNTLPKSQEGIFFFFLYLFTLVGARAYHVFDNWSFYSQNLNQITNTRAGGLGIFGALIGGTIYIFIHSLIAKISFVDLVDSIIPIIPLCQAIGRWGNFLNTEGFGLPTYSQFGQAVPLSFRPPQYQIYSHFHPVWLYESILCFLLFLFLRKKIYHQISFYLIGYGSIRFFTEFFRFDTWTIDNIKVAQVISLLFILVGLSIILFDKISSNQKETLSV